MKSSLFFRRRVSPEGTVNLYGQLFQLTDQPFEKEVWIRLEQNSPVAITDDSQKQLSFKQVGLKRKGKENGTN